MAGSPTRSTPRVIGGVCWPMGAAVAAYFGLVEQAPRHVHLVEGTIIRSLGYVLFSAFTLYAFSRATRIVRSMSANNTVRILPGWVSRIDPREDLATIPALAGELTENDKVEVLALVECAVNWEDLILLLGFQGYRLVAHGRGVCLANIDAQIEVLCTLKSLGRGCDTKSLTLRLGPIPKSLDPT